MRSSPASLNKMQKIKFTKMVGSGNDFVVIEKRMRGLAKGLCNRKYGIGADGLLVLERAKRADIKMRIFNADGSEAEMCGNGARCAAFYAAQQALSAKQRIMIETKAGLIESYVTGNNVKIKLTSPKDIKLAMPLKINGRLIKVNFINTGVPHAVIFVDSLDKIDAAAIGRQVRYHKKFYPAGTNADFVELLSNNSIKVRTYERGVEEETLACGTGAAASALLSAIYYPLPAIRKVNVITRSGEILKVYFDRDGDNFKNVWLEGKTKIVYRGEYYV